MNAETCCVSVTQRVSDQSTPHLWGDKNIPGLRELPVDDPDNSLEVHEKGMPKGR